MANTIWITVTIEQGQSSSAETDLGAEYEGLMVAVPSTTGVCATILIGTVGGEYFLLDKADSNGPLAIPRGKITYVACARGVRYFKLASSAVELAERSYYVKGLRFVP